MSSVARTSGGCFPNREVIGVFLSRATPGHVDLSRYPVIVNMITEAEKSAKVLENLKELLHRGAGRVINHAGCRLAHDARSGRGRCSTAFPASSFQDGTPDRRSKQWPPKASAAPDSCGPIIVRQVGTHTGRTVALHQQRRRCDRRARSRVKSSSRPSSWISRAPTAMTANTGSSSSETPWYSGTCTFQTIGMCTVRTARASWLPVPISWQRSARSSSGTSRFRTSGSASLP